MTDIRVALGTRSYDVRIENGVLRRAGAVLSPFARGRRMVIVTDTNCAEHLATLTASLTAEGIANDTIELAPGEGSKSWRVLESLTDQLLDFGIERSDHVIALGGGVIGDLVGFATSVVKRGCNFIQVPTTLLAQVDSSVGGKTAINARAGKNLIGAFHQPAIVLIDPTVLDTLPARQVAAGYAEVVKYGLIDDPAFFAWCEANGAALIEGDATARETAIAHSVAAKARIVAEDERDRTAHDLAIGVHVHLSPPILGDVPLVPDLERMHPIPEVPAHERHVALPRRERLLRCRRIRRAVVPFRHLRKSPLLGTGIETVPKVEAHDDVLPVFVAGGHGGIGHGIHLKAPLHALDTMPVDRVVMVAHANPLDSKIPLNRPKRLLLCERKPR